MKYTAWCLDSPEDKNFLSNPSSVDLYIGGTLTRALVIGVNTVLVRSGGSEEEDVAPAPIIFPELAFQDANKRDSRVQISRENRNLKCTAGKYLYGLPGEMKEAPMNGVTFKLYLNGALMISSTVNGSSHIFATSSLGNQGGRFTCAVSLKFGLATLKDSSDWNHEVLKNAEKIRMDETREANRDNTTNLQRNLDDLSAQKAQIRKTYLKNGEKERSEYNSELERIKAESLIGKIDCKQFISQLRVLNSNHMRLIKLAIDDKDSEYEKNAGQVELSIVESKRALEEALD